MTLELQKSTPIRLRSVNLDERWLQDRIVEDPSLLGLGDLQIIRRERSQPSGGRIDFLMFDPDSDTRFEVEIMLGALDESHIIRTIEYWDIERQRYPNFEHRAVIVAEEITSRFFNVIRLLNRAVPIIALQLNTFRFEEKIILHFTKVLDVYEAAEEEEGEFAEQTDRRYWDKRANAESLAIVDQVVAMLPKTGNAPRLTYNKFHIALGTTSYNFCWFHPRKAASYCHMHINVGAEKRPEIIKRLENAGIEAGNHSRSSIRLHLNTQDISEHRDLIADVIRGAEDLSHR